MNILKLTASLLLAIGVIAPAAHADTGDGAAVKKPADVDDKRLLSADSDGANWLSYGRTYNEQRFSPLTTINDKTVGKLGLEWSADME
ncbi:MAG: PQQ-dependent dehydrogenase, methanol/ethanol family, partial [Halieaceae bacterium]|nr:PQQ-dependent dehydrogenase, methanol/ethanol family [Halieaceae bacterium]